MKFSVPSSSAPVISCPYRINPPTDKQVDVVSDKVLAASFIQHFTSPWASPIRREKTGVIRVTVNSKKLKNSASLASFPSFASMRPSTSPAPDDILSPFAFLSIFRTIAVHKDKPFSQRLWKHNFKLFPSKATIGANDTDVFGHIISPVGIKSNTGKIEALTKHPTPNDTKQLLAPCWAAFLATIAPCAIW